MIPTLIPGNPPSAGWQSVLAAAGFEAMAGCPRFRHPRSGLAAGPSGEDWFVLRAPAAAAGPRPRGLWKRVTAADGPADSSGEWRCDLPFGERGLAGEDREHADLRRRLLEWAESTLAAEGSAGEPIARRVQERESVSLAGRGLLRSVQVLPPDPEGTGFRLRGELVSLPAIFRHTPGRWRMLSRTWAHAHRVLRMVHVECEDTEFDWGHRIVASVDCSGAPPEAVEGLREAGLESLRLAARWLTPVGWLLASTRRELASVDLAPGR